MKEREVLNGVISVKNAIRLYKAGYRAKEFAHYWKCHIPESSKYLAARIYDYEDGMDIREEWSVVGEREMLGLANFNNPVVCLPAPTIIELSPELEDRAVEKAIEIRKAINAYA